MLQTMLHLISKVHLRLFASNYFVVFFVIINIVLTGKGFGRLFLLLFGFIYIYSMIATDKVPVLHQFKDQSAL